MDCQYQIMKAIDVVLAWDVSDETLPDALQAQARFLTRTFSD